MCVRVRVYIYMSSVIVVCVCGRERASERVLIDVAFITFAKMKKTKNKTCAPWAVVVRERATEREGEKKRARAHVRERA